MDSQTPPPRITYVKQSSMAPERDELEFTEAIDPTVRLMYSVNEGDLEAINELLDSGLNVNYRDIDERTALHIAACQGRTDVVELLLGRGAEIDRKDRWGSTPLADAIYYKNHDVIKLLEKRGAKPLMAPMHVKNIREIPEYEIDPKELDFTDSVDITKVEWLLDSEGWIFREKISSIGSIAVMVMGNLNVTMSTMCQHVFLWNL